MVTLACPLKQQMYMLFPGSGNKRKRKPFCHYLNFSVSILGALMEFVLSPGDRSGSCESWTWEQMRMCVEDPVCVCTCMHVWKFYAEVDYAEWSWSRQRRGDCEQAGTPTQLRPMSTGKCSGMSQGSRAISDPAAVCSLGAKAKPSSLQKGFLLIKTPA